MKINITWDSNSVNVSRFWYRREQTFRRCQEIFEM